MNAAALSHPLIRADELLSIWRDATANGARQAPVLLDCRFDLGKPEAGFEAWQQGHLPGAHYLHLDRDLSGPILPGRSGRHPMPDPAALIAKLRALGVGPETPMVFYDASGGPFAARGWWLACHLGHPAAAVLDGGIDAWIAAGGELETAVPEAPAQPAPPWPDRAPLLDAVSAADVAAHLGGSTPLIDARSLERFAGEQEPIDPVAGHIPGASCLPHGGNLDDQGYFRPAAELAERWRGIDADAAICYCGSGVTAAHDVLAAVAAGVGRPRLYVGSWSDWITDSSRPIARGRS